MNDFEKEKQRKTDEAAMVVGIILAVIVGFFWNIKIIWAFFLAHFSFTLPALIIVIILIVYFIVRRSRE